LLHVSVRQAFKNFYFLAFSHFNEIFTVKISNDLPVNSSHSQKIHILPL